MGTFKGNHNLSSLNRQDVSKDLLQGTRITLSNPFHKMFHTMQRTNTFCQGRELGARQLHNNTSIFFFHAFTLYEQHVQSQGHNFLCQFQAFLGPLLYCLERKLGIG